MDTITITVSGLYKPKKWEILKIQTKNQWTIVTGFENENNGYTINTEPINLSKWKYIRKFQMWMISKIFISK